MQKKQSSGILVCSKIVHTHFILQGVDLVLLCSTTASGSIPSSMKLAELPWVLFKVWKGPGLLLGTEPIRHPTPAFSLVMLTGSAACDRVGRHHWLSCTLPWFHSRRTPAPELGPGSGTSPQWTAPWLLWCSAAPGSLGSPGKQGGRAQIGGNKEVKKTLRLLKQTIMNLCFWLSRLYSSVPSNVQSEGSLGFQRRCK